MVWGIVARGALAVAAGACMPLQATVNGLLAAGVGSAAMATAISISISTMLLLGSLLLCGPPHGQRNPGLLRPWMFASGLIMPCYVLVIIVLSLFLRLQVNHLCCPRSNSRRRSHLLVAAMCR